MKWPQKYEMPKSHLALLEMLKAKIDRGEKIDRIDRAELTASCRLQIQHEVDLAARELIESIVDLS